MELENPSATSEGCRVQGAGCRVDGAGSGVVTPVNGNSPGARCQVSIPMKAARALSFNI